jgi:hypothetical protein
MTMRFATIVVAFAVAGVGSVRVGRAAPGGLADPLPMAVPSGLGFPLARGDTLKLRDITVRDRAKAKQESGKLVSAIQLSCELTDAALIGRGKGNADGKIIDVNAYEVACSNRAGYILVSQGAQNPVAISCFAANAMHAARDAKDESADLYCQLAANKDVKVMAASLMATAGTTCAVNDVRWFGQNALTQTDYSEVACADGNGFLLRIAQTGPAAEVSVIGCQEAAKRGLKCHLTDGGAVTSPVTLQAFRDALKQNEVNCEPTNMRIIGRESVDKRYVVEVTCQEQPNGLVAFIPVAGNTNKFEAIDCAAAVERQIRCELGAK